MSALGEGHASGAGAVRPAAAGRNRLRIGHVAIDQVTFAEALDAVESLVTAGEGGYVVTPNIDHVVNAESNPAFRDAYAAARLSLADGMPLVWASRLLGTPLPERIAGSDFVLPLVERAARRGWSVYLLGGAPGSAEKAAARLRSEYGARIAGVDAPVVTAGGEDVASLRALETLRATRPDLVLVGFGSPKQELWLHRHAEALRPAVGLAVGAAIDFVAGRVPRAPGWMSRNGLEWLYRLTREPKRLWRRYLVNDPKVLPVLWRELRASGTAA